MQTSNIRKQLLNSGSIKAGEVPVKSKQLVAVRKADFATKTGAAKKAAIAILEAAVKRAS